LRYVVDFFLFFDSHAQVFTDGALDALSALHKVDGDGGIRPCLAPLKPWPVAERDKILSRIMNLPYINESHIAEWKCWFAGIVEVR
jgi:hypothetical protein